MQCMSISCSLICVLLLCVATDYANTRFHGAQKKQPQFTCKCFGNCGYRLAMTAMLVVVARWVLEILSFSFWLPSALSANAPSKLWSCDFLCSWSIPRHAAGIVIGSASVPNMFNWMQLKHWASSLPHTSAYWLAMGPVGICHGGLCSTR